MSEFYYSRELGHLRELAAEFARAHPALAPMLSEQSADPDVERLLEGTAFLSGLLSEKLENDLPEIVHGLMRLVLPHYLRPIPSMSIIQFSPKPSLRETVTVPRGTRIDSVPVNSVSCGFSTCYDVPLHPLQLTHAAYQHVSGQSAR
ncbi:MAG: type VI secretion system baseplate subunit TssF, partial [Desulfovermiculus sp.]